MRIARIFPIAVLIVVAWFVSPAAAVLQFYKVFQAEYVDNHSDSEFVEVVTNKKNRCLVCHQGKKRKHHNEFGEHLEDLLDRKKDAKDTEKIVAALKKVAAMPFDPNDPNSETYAERIAAGKWPAGELEDLKKNKEESDDDHDH